MNETTEKKKWFHPLTWVTSSYVAEGIPFAMVIWVAAKIFKDLGHSDSEITVATASIGIVWSLKPLWAGFLDMFKTKKFFVLTMEFVMGLLFVLMGLALHLEFYFEAIIGIMWVVAFASATQDICVDGVYITSLSNKDQARYIGFPSFAWNLGRVVAVAGVVWIAAYGQDHWCMAKKTSWMVAMFAGGGLMTVFGLFHMLALPVGSVPASQSHKSVREIFKDFVDSAADFCNKRYLWGMLAFVFFFRSSEGLLLVEAPLYMQGCMENGGLQLSLAEIGWLDGMISTVAGVLGGLLGGFFVAKYSLKRTLFILALFINVPNATYLYLSHMVTYDDPRSFYEIATVVSLEKFFYNFGFVGNMLFMMQQIAPGKFKMTHYAFATAFMNLVLVPTQMASGPLADSMGFQDFFVLVLFAMIPSLIAAWYVPFPQLKTPDGAAFVDDPVFLEERDRRIQASSKRATIFAILAMMVFLYPDVLSLGWMSRASTGYAVVGYLVWFAISLLIKLWLASKAIVSARKALSESKEVGGSVYGANAKGALIAGAAMLAIAVTLGYFNVKTVRTTNWACAFGTDSKACIQGAETSESACKNEYIRRAGGIEKESEEERASICNNR